MFCQPDQDFSMLTDDILSRLNGSRPYIWTGVSWQNGTFRFREHPFNVTPYMNDSIKYGNIISTKFHYVAAGLWLLYFSFTRFFISCIQSPYHSPFTRKDVNLRNYNSRAKFYCVCSFNGFLPAEQKMIFGLTIILIGIVICITLFIKLCF